MIRKALTKDVDDLMKIISDAKQLLKASGSLQWNLEDGYPNRNTIQNDINNEVLYLYEEIEPLMRKVIRF